MSDIAEIKLDTASRLKTRDQIRSHAGVEFDVVEITPDDAREMLQTTRHEAQIDKIAVNSYAKAMEAGAWIPNMQPIILDTEGKVLDGIHRLEACVQSGKSFRTMIAYNVSPDTLHTIDQHRRRSYSGVLEARGYKHASALRRTLSKLIHMENGRLFRLKDGDTLAGDNMRVSWSRLDKVLAANPEIVEAVEIAQSFRDSILHATPRPIIAFMAIKAGKKKELRSFLSEMSDYKSISEKNAATQLGFQLDSLRQTRQRRGSEKIIESHHETALAILAFNDFCAGRVPSGPYVWRPELPRKNAKESDRAALAASNYGMPTVDGYPGLKEGMFDAYIREHEDLSEDMVNDLRAGIKRGERSTIKESVRLRLVTPEMAREWLSQFNLSNRKIQEEHIKVIARDIQDGYWMVNAQPICFAGDPEHPSEETRLLNGQHRLRGIVLANMPIEIPVAINIQPEAFATYDVQAKKAITGFGLKGDARVVAAAAKFQWRVDRGEDPLKGSRPSSSNIAHTIETHPEMASYFPIARKKEYADLATAGVMVFFLYHVNRERPDLAEQFLEDLTTGAGLDQENPVLTSGWKARGARKESTRKEALKLLLDTWEAYKEWKDEKSGKNRLI